MEPVLRPAARVVLLDPDDCILLQRIATNEGWDGWITPGGAIEAGESAFDAALRELIEEVGLRNVTLGPPLWTRRHVFTWNGVLYDQRETYFVAHLGERVEAAPTMSAEQMAHDGLDEQRWWQLDELEGVNTAPGELLTLVRDYLSSGAPAFPIEIGV